MIEDALALISDFFGDTLLVCLLLDPRLKLSLLPDQTHKNKAKQLLKNLFTEYSAVAPNGSATQLTQASQGNSTQSQSASNRPKNTLSLLERFYSGSTASNDVSSVKEVDQYFAEPTVTSAYDKAYDILLSYWKVNQAKYPVLCKIARDYLAILPMSVPSERAFSQ